MKSLACIVLWLERGNYPSVFSNGYKLSLESLVLQSKTRYLLLFFLSVVAKTHSSKVRRQILYGKNSYTCYLLKLGGIEKKSIASKQ